MTVQQLLRERIGDSRDGLAFEDERWSWDGYVDEAAARATALDHTLRAQRPPHVGVLLDNVPEMAFLIAAAGLGGFVLVGLNTTRRGEALARDVRHADCQLVMTDSTYVSALQGLDLGSAQVLDVGAASWRAQVKACKGKSAAGREVASADLFMLIFTSGTSGEPKAVNVTHEKVAFPGAYMVDRFGLTREDRCYVAMPLFHSNAVMAGWGVALAAGATVVLRRRFSATRFLDDVRAHGATYMNYVGKPLAYVLATPESPGDGDNPLRLAFGNEASERDIVAFAKRFRCQVVDGFGSTENAVVVSRVPGTPTGSLGQPADGVAVLSPATGQECPPAVFGHDGAVSNLDQAVGELVNTTGPGQFAGYYNDEAATAERMRDGMYWSGDLAYRDEAGFVYYAGRTSDWLRVDGENLAAAPIERILLRHPDVNRVAVYAVPDPHVGDQVMAAVVLQDGASFNASRFTAFLESQADLGTKMWPRFVRVAADLPATATNKILKRELVEQGVSGEGHLWVREERGTAYARA